jgi:N-acetylneuraminic acid mutarotase
VISLLRTTLTIVLAGPFLGTTWPVLADLDSGLVARYQLDGNGLDSCGAHDGVAYGAAQTADRFGYDKGACYFATNRYIEISDAPAFHLQQLSVSVWVQPELLNGYSMVLSKDDGGRGLQFYLQGAAGVCLAWFGLGDGSWHNLMFAATFVPGQWAHLAATYDGQYLRTFVDGNPAGMLLYSGTNAYGSRPVAIARNTYSGNEYFAGALDDLRLYNRALSLSEIQQLALERPGVPFRLCWQPAGFGLPGTGVVSWQSWTGWSYSARVATNLDPGPWAEAPAFTHVPGTGQTLVYTNYLGPADKGFVRVSAQGPTAPVQPWANAPPLPLPKADLTVAACNGRLYAIGGYNLRAADPRNETFEFDPATSQWLRKSDMPSPRWGPIAVEFSGKLEVFGGQGPSGGSAKHEVYDPLTDAWQSRPDIPAGLAAQGLMGVRLGERIHLFYKQTHYEYDPATDTYVLKAAVPTGRTWGTCAVVNNLIYVIGGYAYPGGPTNINEVYNPASDTWTVKAPLPNSQYGVTRENPVIGGLIYVTHGQNAPFYTDNYVYNPANNSWTRKTSARHPRDGVGCCVLNGKLYVLGGRADKGGPYGLIDHEVYDPAADN